ncbi:ribosomal-protein-alanine N-acetyltransferase [Nonomuraea endophytica]|uniref:Ribosomal-protein-alanine N-acetyltransferase n=1 Tax=Nonomuraea endophytica TaxID=714136 RepID=A0A7W7ZWR2_9ACTN|nr:ribosomal-protein-alanine N-acetyltransferase [Nonomuraea endophytica]
MALVDFLLGRRFLLMVAADLPEAPSRDSVSSVMENGEIERGEQTAVAPDVDLGCSSRVVLRRITMHDQDEFLERVRASVKLNLPATPDAFQAFLSRFDEGRSAEGLLVCLVETGAIAGNVNINSIIRGCFQSGSLGYATFTPYAGRGYMSEGLGLVLRHAFEELRLHRLEAQIRPDNRASIKLVQRYDFRYEGYSPDLLFIDGEWRGHGRWALTNDMHGVVPIAPHPTLPNH